MSERDTTIHLPPVDLRSEEFADMMADYPFPDEVDSIDELPRCIFIAADDGKPFTAQVLGFGSSYVSKKHKNHEPGEPLPKGERCSKCRWTDTAILWCADNQHYVFVSMGKSAIPGEWQRDTIIWTQDPQEVLRECFVPTKPKFTRDKGAKAIPPHNADAFRQAAAVVCEFAELLERYAEVIPEVSCRDADPLADL